MGTKLSCFYDNTPVLLLMYPNLYNTHFTTVYHLDVGLFIFEASKKILGGSGGDGDRLEGRKKM